MPQIEVTTKSAQSVWKSPDGQREIFELELVYEGKPVKAKTYSKDISVPGWVGKVDTYEKDGRNGSETFVKQPPKEGGGYPSGSNPGYYSKGGAGGGKPMADPFTMYLSYAKDIAIACIAVADAKGGLKFNETFYGEVLAAVEAGGAQLYAGRPDAAPAPQPAAPATAPTDTTPEMPADFLKQEPKSDPTQVSIEDLTAVLGDVTKVDEEDTPWNKDKQS